MKEYLRTMRPIGMQQQMQQHPEDKKVKNTTYNEKDIEKYGNSDVKAIAAVYKEFTADGNLSEKEIQALKSMDKALKGVELIYGFDKDAALLVQEDKATFLVLGTEYKRKNEDYIKNNQIKKGK